jgi:hypothetical protein
VLAADGAIAWFLSNLVSFSLDADRTPQLKRKVRPLLIVVLDIVNEIDALND